MNSRATPTSKEMSPDRKAVSTTTQKTFVARPKSSSRNEKTAEREIKAGTSHVVLGEKDEKNGGEDTGMSKDTGGADGKPPCYRRPLSVEDFPCNGQVAGGRWSACTAEKFKLRSKTYLKNKKKLPSGSSVFRIVHCDIFKVKDKVLSNIAEHESGWLQINKDRLPKGAIVLIINLQFRSLKGHILSYHLLEGGLGAVTNPGLRTLLERMMTKGDEWRDERIKMIPRIVEAPYLVRMGVAQRPVIIGKKVKTKYILGEGYIEIDCNVDSSSVSVAAIKLAHSWSTRIVCEIVWLLEGQSESELPERVLAGVRLDKIAFSKAKGKMVHKAMSYGNIPKDGISSPIERSRCRSVPISPLNPGGKERRTTYEPSWGEVLATDRKDNVVRNWQHYSISEESRIVEGDKKLSQSQCVPKHILSSTITQNKTEEAPPALDM
ncbi:hypothetical protein AAMO2058_000909600 [Amorphochlora amoebiformis]|mmetsp:Transcript_22730/g.35709  ORF Transcript_22730/g.35709 Transcript_22730/m.35709 type:complete len:435 (-) Transcript_22730:333-1637(-)